MCKRWRKSGYDRLKPHDKRHGYEKKEKMLKQNEKERYRSKEREGGRDGQKDM